ncbi:hypothetical protein BKA69DRAFT_1125690 [Paraphysoderma sedebokerense]|nr:hypothetical protein BKA69DRAFT_1125690 [Paraphysoderma sedebokerense]
MSSSNLAMSDAQAETVAIELKIQEKNIDVSCIGPSRQSDLLSHSQSVDFANFDPTGSAARFLRTIAAVNTIVQSKLYRIKSISLEDYFKKTFNISRAQVYRLIDCAIVVKDLEGLTWGDVGVDPETCPSPFFSTHGLGNRASKDTLIPVPLRQRVCRALKTLDGGSHSRKSVWMEILKRCVKDERKVEEVTSKEVKNVYEELFQTERDCKVFDMPKPILNHAKRKRVEVDDGSSGGAADGPDDKTNDVATNSIFDPFPQLHPSKTQYHSQQSSYTQNLLKLNLTSSPPQSSTEPDTSDNLKQPYSVSPESGEADLSSHIPALSIPFPQLSSSTSFDSFPATPMLSPSSARPIIPPSYDSTSAVASTIPPSSHVSPLSAVTADQSQPETTTPEFAVQPTQPISHPVAPQSANLLAHFPDSTQQKLERQSSHERSLTMNEISNVLSGQITQPAPAASSNGAANRNSPEYQMMRSIIPMLQSLHAQGWFLSPNVNSTWIRGVTRWKFYHNAEAAGLPTPETPDTDPRSLNQPPHTHASVETDGGTEDSNTNRLKTVVSSKPAEKRPELSSLCGIYGSLSSTGSNSSLQSTSKFTQINKQFSSEKGNAGYDEPRNSGHSDQCGLFNSPIHQKVEGLIEVLNKQLDADSISCPRLPFNTPLLRDQSYSQSPVSDYPSSVNDSTIHRTDCISNMRQQSSKSMSAFQGQGNESSHFFPLDIASPSSVSSPLNASAPTSCHNQSVPAIPQTCHETNENVMSTPLHSYAKFVSSADIPHICCRSSSFPTPVGFRRMQAPSTDTSANNNTAVISPDTIQSESPWLNSEDNSISTPFLAVPSHLNVTDKHKLVTPNQIENYEQNQYLHQHDLPLQFFAHSRIPEFAFYNLNRPLTSSHQFSLPGRLDYPQDLSLTQPIPHTLNPSLSNQCHSSTDLSQSQLHSRPQSPQELCQQVHIPTSSGLHRSSINSSQIMPEVSDLQKSDSAYQQPPKRSSTQSDPQGAHQIRFSFDNPQMMNQSGRNHSSGCGSTSSSSYLPQINYPFVFQEFPYADHNHSRDNNRQTQVTRQQQRHHQVASNNNSSGKVKDKSESSVAVI